MRRSVLSVGALLALSLWLLAGCGATPVGGSTSASSGAATAHKTLAQAGGLRIVVQMTCATATACAAENQQIAQMVEALAQRAQVGLGVTDASARSTIVTPSGRQIEVDLPGYTNQVVATSALTTQGMLRFIDTGGQPLPVGAKVGANQYPTLFTGSQLDPASISAQRDPNGSNPNPFIVTFAFKGAAAGKFAQYTQSNIGAYLTVTLDDIVIESATIQAEISGLGEITGLKSLADAQALAAALKSTPLPDPVSLISAALVQPSAS